MGPRGVPVETLLVRGPAARHGCLGDGAQITGRPLRSLGPQHLSSRKEPLPTQAAVLTGGAFFPGVQPVSPRTLPRRVSSEGQLAA